MLGDIGLIRSGSVASKLEVLTLVEGGHPITPLRKKGEDFWIIVLVERLELFFPFQTVWKSIS